MINMEVQYYHFAQVNNQTAVAYTLSLQWYTVHVADCMYMYAPADNLLCSIWTISTATDIQLNIVPSYRLFV